MERISREVLRKQTLVVADNREDMSRGYQKKSMTNISQSVEIINQSVVNQFVENVKQSVASGHQNMGYANQTMEGGNHTRKISNQHWERVIQTVGQNYYT